MTVFRRTTAAARIYRRTAILALVAVSWISTAQAAAFLPHRAVYDLTLNWTSADSLVTQAGGRYEFEWGDACDGWTVNQRARIAVIYSDGEQVDFGWIMNSWESKDGTQYRFFIRKLHSGASAEEIRGNAELSGDGVPGRALFSLPDQREMALPPGTVFPTRHSLELLDAAAAGEAVMWRSVFDGTGDEGLYGVSAVIAPSAGPPEEAFADSPIIDGQPAWRVDLAFFRLAADTVTPEQEQSVRILKNGITDQIELDYGDFVMDGELAELEALPGADCH